MIDFEQLAQAMGELDEDGYGYYYDPGAFLNLTVLESSAHTRAWLREHLGVVPENQYALEQRSGWNVGA